MNKQENMNSPFFVVEVLNLVVALKLLYFVKSFLKSNNLGVFELGFV